MGKRKATDGYTMVEMILVLFILTILLTLSISHGIHQGNLHFFMMELQDHFMQVRMDAIHTRSTLPFEVRNRTLLLDHVQIDIPKGVSCDVQSFLVYPSGKVNHAGTILCYSGKQKRKLVIQLGSGHVQLE